MTNMAGTIIFTALLILLMGCGGEHPAAETTAESGDAQSQQQSTPVAQSPGGSANAVGETMPAYSASDLEGGTWELSGEKGVTMLNLWATWCGPCRYEIPALIELQKEYGEQGLQVVGVSMDQPGMEPQIESFVRNAGINYKIVHDPHAKLADVFETTIIPTTALIDRDGTIVWYHAGIVRKDDPKMIEALEGALGADQDL